MPIYEYACTACGERTEAKQGFDDPPLEVCQVCGGRLRKLYSPVGVVFKGSGFYSTDSKAKRSTGKSEDKKSDAKSSSGSGGEGSGASSGKSESKPASSSNEKSAT